jgi:hypothetical protein
VNLVDKLPLAVVADIARPSIVTVSAVRTPSGQKGCVEPSVADRLVDLAQPFRDDVVQEPAEFDLGLELRLDPTWDLEVVGGSNLIVRR